LPKFPKEEIYGLTSQMRRADVSIASNIAEGAGRNSTADYIKFVYYSLGSLTELETQLIISNKIGYMKENEFMEDIEILRRKILNFIKHLKSKQSQ
jgi:four helix bundle protein